MTAFLAALALSACATAPAPPPPIAPAAPQETRAPVTVLISIDGFRPDYLDRGVTPNLSRLAGEGVTGPMHPSFPSKTFPNHYTLVTGLRPDRNGIVANNMEDARRPGEKFTMASDDPFWWNAAEPIWITADKAGIRTATMFWPGSNVAIGGTRAEQWPNDISGGTRPDDWQQFNQAVSNPQRVNAVLDWLRRPAAIRPAFVTVYFDTVDTAGHHFGPGDARTTAAVGDVDARIGELTSGLAALGQPANLVIVADHGMAATSSDRVIALDRIAPPAEYRIVESGPYATLVATPGHERALERALLARHEHMTCWRKAEIPARFAYGWNPRVPPYLCLAETGWTIAPTAPTKTSSGGNHGYDNMADDMTALFIAHGPAFATHRTIPAFDNVDVQPMLAALLGIAPGATDGSLKTWNAVRK
ncbi:alkaline phosphatase family protein [Sphingomonas hylomeconis]|uniref:Alkaline phosphatase family protein n=1 Tax=Sphingomonas hylomeconis TaxID=1395958 RepID=A0ABV7T0N0_9SPHN|nr:alkaline phosphatase family protein [Sphingomonas hylomeconis]